MYPRQNIRNDKPEVCTRFTESGIFPLQTGQYRLVNMLFMPSAKGVHACGTMLYSRKMASSSSPWSDIMCSGLGLVVCRMLVFSSGFFVLRKRK